MVRIPTLIPEYAVDWVRKFLSGGAFDVIWKGSVLLVLVFIIIALLVASPVLAGVFGSLLASALWQDDIRKLLMDVYNRNFWVWGA